jgi:hypothetical protein
MGRCLDEHFIRMRKEGSLGAQKEGDSRTRMAKTFFDRVIAIAALPLCVGVVLALRDFLLDVILKASISIRRALSNRSHPRVSVEPARDTTGAACDPIDQEVDTLLKAALQAELGPNGTEHKPDGRRRQLNDHRDQ